MVTRAPHSRWPTRVAIAGGLALIGYAWVVAVLRPFTAPEEILVALPILVVFILAARPGPPPSDRTDRSAPAQEGAIVWLGLAGAIAAWELIALFSSPRDDHPTLSYIADRIMSVPVGRAALVLVWLVLGAALARRATRRHR